MRQFPAVIIMLAAVISCALSAHAEKITFESLLGEMYDLERLTYMPDPAYTTKQFSSYDRRATDPGVLTDENWFANGDRGNHLREEERNGEKEYVMMDAQGPGAIVRFWSANPDDAGVMRIYLDEQPEPVIEMPLSDFLGGRTETAPPPIAGLHGTGWNSYLPIPYARHCKVTCSKPNFYYIINYRAYEAGAEVETYSKEGASADGARSAISTLSGKFENPFLVAGGWEADSSIGNSFTLHAGATVTGLEFSGADAKEAPGIITDFDLSIDPAQTDIEKVLRGIVLEITFDNANQPQVQCPLGDFFGTAPGVNLYKSLVLGMTETDKGTLLYSDWAMPFQKGFTVKLSNTLDVSVQLSAKAGLKKYTWTDDSLYFHAKWRQELNIPTRPRQDWNFATLQGKGRYVGNMLHISNPVVGWWGEGDEKIYVDGETFPSWFGTGSEDYYGYAWSSPMLFTHAYHNQTRCDGPGTYGNDSVNRFHILDDIPFNESFKFDMEIWHWAECIISQSVVNYWYAAPGATDNFESLAGKELIVPEIPPLPEPERVEGAIEGEEMKVLAMSGGKHQKQTSDIWKWSAGAQIWWTDAKVGDTLELAFDAPEAGTYKVWAVYTRAYDYGIVQPYINGEKAGDPYDAYYRDVRPSREMKVGEFKLNKGENTFKVEITGTNPEAQPLYMFGLDYLRLDKVE